MQLHSKMIVTGATLIASALFAPTARAQTAAAICKDGTTATATGRGACSGHGGVTKSATLCEDGSVSKSKGRGACSGHGGVKGATSKNAKPATRKAKR